MTVDKNFVFNSIGVIGIHRNPLVILTIEKIIKYFSSSINIFIENKTAMTLGCKDGFENISGVENFSKLCDVVIIVGGDGNFLNAARDISKFKDIPMIGVNRGNLGFLTDIDPNDVQKVLLDILKGNFVEEYRNMFEVKSEQNGIVSEVEYVMNEVVIGSGYTSRLFELEIYINEHFAFKQRADGMIISTPTGSTAHSLAAGGPIMHPTLEAISLVPISSQSLSSRPIVLSSDSDIVIKIGNYNNPEPLLSVDGNTMKFLKKGDIVRIKKSKKQIRMLHSLDYNYYKTLREKLFWNKMLFETD